MSVTGQDIVNAAYEVLGAPYRTWFLGMSLPTWLDDWRGDPPPASHLQSVGLECLPGDTKVSASKIERSYKRVYSGELVIIKTASGKKLSATPNHPVLSHRGWVAIGSLNKGDHVVCRAFAKSDVSNGEQHKQGKPAPIQQIHSLASKLGYVERRGETSLDFHGDGGNGEVDIVSPNSLLGHGVESSLDEHVAELPLSFANILKIPLGGPSKVNSMLLRVPMGSNSFVGSACLGFTFFRRELASSQLTRFSNRATNTSLMEPVVDNDLGDSEGRRDFPFSFSGKVSPHDLLNINFDAPLTGATRRSHLNAAAFEPSMNPRNGHTEASGNFAEGFSAKVCLEKLVSVDSIDFSGDVYNLQTQSGDYIANDIVTHNCADLVAYAQARNGLSYPYWAGTQSYEYNLVNTSTFDPYTPGEPGAIALSPYRGPAWNDQGHIAIFVDEHRLIQALARGVSDQFTDTETWGWGGSTEFSIYGHLPGVDYSAGGGEGNGSRPTAGWQWLAIDKDGWARFDGPDWSRGWFDTDWLFHSE